MRKYREYTDEDVIKNAKNVFSLSQLLKSLNLTPAGGNYKHIKKTIQRLNINCDHFTGKAWNKGQRLKQWKDYSKISSIKPHLIDERGHRCEVCDKTRWMKNPIPLEVHHKDKDATNNKYNNLILMCPNCHYLTHNS